MLSLPTAFPGDAVNTALVIFKQGAIVARQRDLGESLWNVQGYAENLFLHNAPTDGSNVENRSTARPMATLDGAQQDELSALTVEVNKIVNEPGIRDADIAAIGDGKLLERFKTVLPYLLWLAQMFGVKLPTLPGLTRITEALA